MPLPSLLDGYVYHIIARLGNDADVPAAQNGEILWSQDVKALRMGDDTSNPPYIATTKSTGYFDYSSAQGFKFPSIDLVPGATIAGINPNSLNTAQGILVRTTPGEFAARQIVSGDGTILVTDPTGLAGNIDVRLNPASPALIAFTRPAHIVSAISPASPLVGDYWHDTTTNILYYFDNDGATSAWRDISSGGGGGGGGINFVSDSIPPVSPNIGTLWLDTDSDTLYIRINDGSSDLWLDITSAGGNGGLPLGTQGDVDSGISNSVGITPAQLKSVAGRYAHANIGVFGINTGQEVPVIWNSIADTSNFLSGGSPTRITVPSTVSRMRITANISWLANATGYRRVRIRKNGSDFNIGMPDVIVPAVNGTMTSMNICSGSLPVSGGDYFEILVTQTSGALLTADNTSGRTWLSVEAIA